MRYYYKQKNGNSLLCLLEELNDENYVEITEEEYDELNPSTSSKLNQTEKRIIHLKNNLKATDYQAIKYAEGWITEEEYAPIKAQRQEWRDEINELEAMLL